LAARSREQPDLAGRLVEPLDQDIDLVAGLDRDLAVPVGELRTGNHALGFEADVDDDDVVAHGDHHAAHHVAFLGLLERLLDQLPQVVVVCRSRLLLAGVSGGSPVLTVYHLASSTTRRLALPLLRTADSSRRPPRLSRRP